MSSRNLLGIGRDGSQGMRQLERRSHVLRIVRKPCLLLYPLYRKGSVLSRRKRPDEVKRYEFDDEAAWPEEKLKQEFERVSRGSGYDPFAMVAIDHERLRRKGGKSQPMMTGTR